MTKKVFVVFALVALLGLSGCYHMHHTVGSAQKSVTMHDANLINSKNFEIKKAWVSMWLWGLVGKDINVDQIISREIGDKKQISKLTIDSQMSFLNGLVNMITVGIYSPMEVTLKGEYK
jgi:hypothetical protein